MIRNVLTRESGRLLGLDEPATVATDLLEPGEVAMLNHHLGNVASNLDERNIEAGFASAGLVIADVEVLQLHYAETLKAWRERFLAHRDEVLRLYDQRFVRMWEFYLACSEMAFRQGDMVVFQIQMAKQKGVIPATRDYIAREEARLRALETGYRLPLRLAGE